MVMYDTWPINSH